MNECMSTEQDIMNKIRDSIAVVPNLDTSTAVAEQGQSAEPVCVNFDADYTYDNKEYYLYIQKIRLKEFKKQILLKVLVCREFLKDKDPELYQHVIQIESDCWIGFRNNVPGYKSLPFSLRQHLFPLIPDVYWSTIEKKVYKLEQERKQKKQEQQQRIRLRMQQQQRQQNKEE